MTLYVRIVDSQGDGLCSRASFGSPTPFAFLVRCLRRVTVVLAGTGLLLPPCHVLAVTGADGSPRPSRSSDLDPTASGLRQTVRDVSLDGAGTLRGVVLDVTGVPVAHVEVKASRQGRIAAIAMTDASGQFRVDGLRGGLWRVEGGNAQSLFRLWTVGTAPPTARGLAVLQARRSVIRGQNNQGYRLTTDGVLLGAVLLGGAAVPVIVDRGGSDPPSGS